MSYAATAFTILSAPTSFGLSVIIGMPVLRPGPTTMGVILKYLCDTSKNVSIRGGTTQEIIAPSTPHSPPFFIKGGGMGGIAKWKRSISIIPYSSAVLAFFVPIRQ